jgi:hypothetical protein
MSQVLSDRCQGDSNCLVKLAIFLVHYLLYKIELNAYDSRDGEDSQDKYDPYCCSIHSSEDTGLTDGSQYCLTTR